MNKSQANPQPVADLADLRPDATALSDLGKKKARRQAGLDKRIGSGYTENRKGAADRRLPPVLVTK